MGEWVYGLQLVTRISERYMRVTSPCVISACVISSVDPPSVRHHDDVDGVVHLLSQGLVGGEQHEDACGRQLEQHPRDLSRQRLQQSTTTVSVR